MIIPKKIKVGGHTYKVTYHVTSDICNDVAAEGTSNKENGTIDLRTNVIRSEMEATFIHEVFHVMNSQLDHELLESLTQQMYQFLTDNKMLK